MLGKLAVRNTKRSIKDYLIYLITITISFSLILAFNLIASSDKVVELSTGMGSFKTVLTFINAVIVFVVCFLINYTTRFMFEKRSKELGTYMLLGIKKKKVAHLLVTENILLGFLAFVLSIPLGFLFSQFVSLVIVKMLGIPEVIFISLNLISIELLAIYFMAIYVLVLQYWAKAVQQDEEKVLNKIQKVGNAERIREKKKKASTLKKAENRQNEIDRLFAKMYEDRACEKITERNFIMLSGKYQKEQIELEQQITNLREELSKMEQDMIGAEKWIELIKEYSVPKELTAPLLNAMIEKILIHEATTNEDNERIQEIEIYYRFIGKVE